MVEYNNYPDFSGILDRRYDEPAPKLDIPPGFREYIANVARLNRYNEL